MPRKRQTCHTSRICWGKKTIRHCELSGGVSWALFHVAQGHRIPRVGPSNPTVELDLLLPGPGPMCVKPLGSQGIRCFVTFAL